ncbi:MAG: hypothetical protein U9Q92_00135, partial [archaeon]|nr:hypothetical protein [archaeon]
YWSEKKRKEELKMAAGRMAFSFSPDGDNSLLSSLGVLKLFSKGYGRKAYNIIKGEMDRIHWTVFDYRYTVGGGRSSTTYSQTVACAQLDVDLPKFSLGAESFFHKLGDVLGYKDIDFKSSPVFSDRYLLKGPDEASVRKLFTPEILTFFENRKDIINIEAAGSRIIIYRNNKKVNPDDMRSFISEASKIARMFAKDKGTF